MTEGTMRPRPEPDLPQPGQDQSSGEKPEKPEKSRVRRTNTGALLCRHCNSREMRKQPRVGWQSVSFFEPYQCGRCNKKQTRLQLSWRIPAGLVALVALSGGGWFLWNNPPALTDWLNGGGDTTQALARARAATGGQLSAFEEMMVRRPKSTMSNASVLELAKAGVRPDVIVRLIRASTVDFDLRAPSVVELKKAGVDEAVILAMIDQTYGSR